MNDVYKRQPIVHKLPVGWNDLDNVKFTNMNSIKGLQHVDNPLVAEQNSTYDCKNVYQDESNNLTVRPALRFTKNVLASDLCGYYKTSKGEIVITNKAGAFFLNNTPIGNANITVQENDGHVYVMYTGLDNKLAFAEYDGYGLVQIEPDILTNIADNIIPSLYNLLSDRIRFETVPNLRAEASIPESLYTAFKSYTLPYDDVRHISILSDGSIITASDNIVRLWYLYSGSWSTIKFELPLFGSGTKFIIQSDSTASATTIKVSNIAGNTITLDKYTLGYFGNFNKVSKVFSIDPGVTLVSDILDHYPLYNDDQILVRFKNSDNELETLFVFNSSGEVLTYEPLADEVKEIAVSRDDVTVLCLGWPDNDIVVLSTSDWSYISYNLTGIPKSLCGSASKTYIITEDNNTMYLQTDQTTAVVLPTDGDMVLESVGSDISIYTPNSDKISYYGDDGLQVYDIPVTASLAFIARSGQTLVTYENSWLLNTREFKPQYKYEYREVSEEFPVLSQIEDEVLTSFYLDNIYWFVTKRRVFGTGVADGRFSIKYFDPKKYFYFDEELTGAIRVSDSSFWVFHNSGAYLIYKSTAEMYDQLSQQYIETITWLCTNTAKSKGCDFDNALTVLPTSNYIACVTSDDISVVRLLENVQSDERVLAPLTLNLSKFVSGLLHVTKDVKIAIYKYNTIFFLNPQNENGIVPALVYNIVTESWWYWEFPFDSITQVYNTEENIDLIAKIGDNWAHYDLYTEYYDHTVGALTYHIYGDRLPDGPAKIDWFWDSAILHFNTTDYKKQLLAVNFTFAERESCSISFDYNFAIYDREYSSCSWSEITNVVERVNTYSRKNVISKFAYLQICLRSPEKDDEWESYTRPKFSTISLKYRILPGGI